MSRLRIMHVIDSLRTGGTEEGIRKLLSGLDPAVFEQVVCTVAPSPPIDAKTGARVISLERTGDKRQALVSKFKRIFDRERPHVVHSRNWGTIEAVVAARLARVRTVVHSEHGLESSTYRSQPWRRRIIRQLCFTWADRAFAVSDGLRNYYARQLWMGKGRIDVIPNGVDTEKYRPQQDVRREARLNLGAGPETLVIGTVGRLDPIKDHATLFLAVDSLLALGFPVQLVIVGDGPQRSALEQEVQGRKSLAGRTLFVGETSDIVSYLNAFDVFVLPSLAEGMSNALLEAMAVGVACVATRVGGNPELIEDGISGVLFDAGDSQTLGAHLKLLAIKPQSRQELGASARRRVEKFFGLRRMLSNYARLYEEALSNKHAEPAIVNYARAVRTWRG